MIACSSNLIKRRQPFIMRLFNLSAEVTSPGSIFSVIIFQFSPAVSMGEGGGKLVQPNCSGSNFQRTNSSKKSGKRTRNTNLRHPYQRNEPTKKAQFRATFNRSRPHLYPLLSLIFQLPLVWHVPELMFFNSHTHTHMHHFDATPPSKRSLMIINLKWILMKTCNIARPSAMKSQREAVFGAGGPVFATNFTGAETVPVAWRWQKASPGKIDRRG